MGSFSLGVALSLIMLVALGKELSTLQPAPVGALTTPKGPRTAQKAVPLKQRQRVAAKSRKDRGASVPVTIASPPAETPAQAIDRAWRSQAFLAKDFSPTRLFTTVLPGGVQTWAQNTFQSASAPTFDALVLALALLLSLFSIVRGMFRWERFEPHVQFYNKDLVAIAGLPLLVLVLVLGAAEDNQ